MAYFYTKKVFANLTDAMSNASIYEGDFFLIAVDNTSTTGAGVYKKTGTSTYELLSTQPISTDSVIIILDDQEWKFFSGTTYKKQSALSAGAAIRLAVINYNSGATKPVPVGTSSFPDSIDVLKILDYSAETSAHVALKDYYTALSNFYTTPTSEKADIVQEKAIAVQNYILTETDYNKLASAVLNLQLYTKQYLEDQFVAVGDAIEAYINNSVAGYFAADKSGQLVFIGTSDPNGAGNTTGRNYVWFDTTN
jgi:hypothetical protein